MKLAHKIDILLERAKASTTLPDKYASNDVAMAMIQDEIKNMAYEIDKSEKGTRNQVGYGKDKLHFINKSTFPEYLQPLFNNAGTKKKFLSAANRGKGKVWDRIALIAIDRLENGYKNKQGYDDANQDFIDVVKNPVPF